MNSPSIDAELDAIFETMNGSGAHACYCERSVDGGCKCAIKDEYVTEAKAALTRLLVEAMNEVIGEDERYTMTSEDDDYERASWEREVIQIENLLRAEQRERLATLTNMESKE